MVFTLASVSAVSLVIALGLMYKRIGKKFVPWLMAIAGIGPSGIFGALVERIVSSLVGGISSATSKLLGAGVGGLVLVAWLTIVLLPHMKPKGQPPTKFTPWVAFVYPSVLVAVGGIFSGLAGLSGNIVTQAAGMTWSTISAVIGGF
jgi:hypothetical protein